MWTRLEASRQVWTFQIPCVHVLEAKKSKAKQSTENLPGGEAALDYSHVGNGTIVPMPDKISGYGASSSESWEAVGLFDCMISKSTCQHVDLTAS